MIRRRPGALLLFVFPLLLLGADAAGQDPQHGGGVAAPPAGLASAPAAPADTVPAPDSLPPIEKMPVLINFVKASYPADLVKRGVEGTVLLDLVVSDSGRVDSVSVRQGIHPSLDSAAAVASRSFRFSPAVAGGKAVPVLMEYAYRFTIGEELTRLEEFVNFKGRVFERGSRAPLGNALILVSFPDTSADSAVKVPFRAYLEKIGGFGGQYLQEGALVTTTDSTGAFQFKSLPFGPIIVKVIVADYENFTDNEILVRGKATDVVYRLQRISYGTNEIVVYGKTEKKEVAQQTLTLNEVKKIPGLGGDAVKVVQALPSVARSAFNMGSIIVRGSGNGDTKFFVDGVTLPVLFHFGGLISTYNSDALSSVDLYPGGFGVRYGGALGGIVEITGRRPKTDRIHGYLDGNLFDASFMAEGPISKSVSFLVTARRSYIANVLTFFLEKVAKLSLPFTVVPYYWDYIARLDADVAKNQHCYLTVFSSNDKMEMITTAARGGSKEIDENTSELNMNTYFQMAIAGWDWDIDKKLKNNFRYAICDFSEDMGAFGFVKVKERSLAHFFRDDVKWTLSDAFSFTLGADVQYVPYNLDLTLTSARNQLVRDTSHFDFGPFGVYLGADWKPTNRFELLPGIRYDYYPELSYKGSVVPEFFDYHFIRNGRGISGEPSARLLSKFELVKNHKLKAAVGSYSETPQPQGQAIDKAWGNPKLPAEKGSHWVLGYEWKISDLISADVQAYYNRQWDMSRTPSTLEMAAAAAQGSELPKYVSNGKAKMKGIEILIKHDQNKRFFGWIAYSVSRSERWNFDENRWVIFSQDQTHNLQLIGSMRFKGLQEAGVRLRLGTGNPTTPIIGSEYDATNFTYTPVYGARNSARMAPFLSLDLRYEKKVTLNLWQVTAYVDITHTENLFNQGYRSPETNRYQWNYDYSDKQVFSDVTRPAVGIKIDF